MTPQEQYFKETGAKTIWKIPNHTHTDEYVEWIKSYVKNSDSPAAKMVRKFSKALSVGKTDSQPHVSNSLPLFRCKCGYETSNSVAWCVHADLCNGNNR